MALLLGAAAGCAPAWSRPGATAEDLRRDHAECARLADVLEPPLFPYGGGNLGKGGPLVWRPRPAFSPRTYRTCMEQRGYRPAAGRASLREDQPYRRSAA